jgi:voltage-gated potassium channel
MPQRRSSNRPKTADLRQLHAALALLVCVFTAGVLGYRIIEHWPLLDSFYMTVITLSTVGYREVLPLSPTGKLFTAGLIISGVTTVAFGFSVITRSIVEGELAQHTEQKRMQRRIAALENHVIVCGFGRLAAIVVRELLEAGEDVLVIENDPTAIERLRTANAAFIDGSAYEDDVLKSGGIERARILVSLLPSDSDNVYVTLSARDLNPKLEIIARTEGEAGEKRLRRAGANQVIAPYRVAGSNIVQQLIRPNVSEFLQFAAGKGSTPLVLEEVQIPLESQLGGKTLEQAAIPAKTGAIIAAIISPDDTMRFNPGGKDVIEPGSTIIVLGQPGSLDKLSELL